MKSTRPKFKRIAKLSISLTYYLYSRARQAIRRLAKGTSPPTCVILYYHSVATEDRARFAAQMDALKRLATPIPAGSENPLRPGRHYAAVTFDDGFTSVGENAVPELVQRRIPATIFIVSDVLGAIPNWDAMGQEECVSGTLMSLQQLQELPSEFITIGSHSLSHPFLPSVTEEQATREIAESKKKLSGMLAREITLFSFPYGGFNQRLLDICRATGYRRVFTILPRLAFSSPQEFATGRVAVDPTDWPLEFRLKLLGAYQWLPYGISAKRKIASWAGACRGAVGRLAI